MDNYDPRIIICNSFIVHLPCFVISMQSKLLLFLPLSFTPPLAIDISRTKWPLISSNCDPFPFKYFFLPSSLPLYEPYLRRSAYQGVVWTGWKMYSVSCHASPIQSSHAPPLCFPFKLEFLSCAVLVGTSRVHILKAAL